MYVGGAIIDKKLCTCFRCVCIMLPKPHRLWSACGSITMCVLMIIHGEHIGGVRNYVVECN